MILSKQNLEIYSVPQTDKGIPVLNNVHVTAEGATIAANSKSFIAVSPVTDMVKNSLPLKDVDANGLSNDVRKICGGENGKDGFSISIGLAKEVCNAMPPDTVFGGLTEHTVVSPVMSENSEVLGELKFETTDGKRKKILAGKKFDRKYIEYRGFLKKIFNAESRKVKLVLNRKRLLTLINVLEKLCADKTGHSLIFVEVNNDNELILRSLNPRTGQHVSAFMTSYSQEEEEWIENDEWEKQFVDTKKNARIPKG